MQAIGGIPTIYLAKSIPTELRRLCPQIVPVAGLDIVVNGNMETGDPPDNWSVTGASGAILRAAADERTGGTGLQSLEIENGAALYGAAGQTVAISAGQWVDLSAWLKRITGAVGLRLGSVFIGYGLTVDTWVHRAGVLRTLTNDPAVNMVNTTNVIGNLARVDDVICRPLTFSTLRHPLGRRRRLAGSYRCHPTVLAGTQAGLLIGYSDDNSFILVNHNGTSAVLVKRIAGTYTEVRSATATYSAAAPLDLLILPDEQTYVLAYNGSLVGFGLITDVMAGRQVQGFSTLSTNDVGLVQTSRAYGSVVYSGVPVAPVSVPGVELLTNPGFEGVYAGAGSLILAPDWANDGGVDAEDTWSEDAVNVHGGISAQRIATFATFRGVRSANANVVAGTWYRASIWHYKHSGNNLRMLGADSLDMIETFGFSGSAAYAQVTRVARVVSTGTGQLRFVAHGGASDYSIDDASLKPLTGVTSYVCDAGTRNAAVRRAVTCSAGEVEGFQLWANAASNPTSYLEARVDRARNRIILSKNVAGTITELIAATFTYVAGARLEVVPFGTSVLAQYNGTIVGTVQNVTDAGFGQHVHLLSTEGISSEVSVYA